MTTKAFSLATLMPAGGTIGATLLLGHTPPTAANEAASKSYVDSSIGGIGEAPLNTTTYGRLNGAWTPALSLAGGTMTGPITLSANPVAPMQPATQQYVTTQMGAYLPLVGGTLAGNLFLNADPTSALGAATKNYVDTRGALTDAPSNSTAYGRMNGAWVQVMPLSGGTVSGGITGAAGGQTLDNFSIDAGTF